MKTYPEKPNPGRAAKPAWYSTALVAFIATDVPAAVGLDPAAFARDLQTLEQRLSAEGESFLTKTLPQFGKSYDLALQGHVRLTVSGFRKRKPCSALPAFLQALTSRVFDDDGWIRVNPCTTSIRLTRQILLWFKKIQKGFSDESLQKAAIDLINVDRALPDDGPLPPSGLRDCARAVVSAIFRNTRGISDPHPRHGPGAVAGGEGPVAKRELRISYLDLEEVFRPIPWLRSLREASVDPDSVLGRPQCKYGLSRTEFVEKDSSGPRVIGLEPAEYMWCQQSIKDWMYAHIENNRYTRGRVNFTDQTINRSLTTNWADYDTLDMSKASDRNSLALVKDLFSGVPGVLRYLLACRTPGTVLPSGEVLWFKKFAPMGSATCFPVQAIVYYALACASLHVNGGIPLGIAMRNVYVYGDDLVVPHGFFSQLNADFEDNYLKFNMDKCCIHGKFRESCGADTYDGVDVTPIRLKRAYPGRSAVDLIPVIKHINNLMQTGYRAASRALRRAALRIFPSLRELSLPTSPIPDLPIFYWLDSERPSTVKIWLGKDSMFRVKGWTFEPKTVRANEAEEERYLRESLSRAGPVGTMKGPDGQRFRVLQVRYVGAMRRKTLVVVPTSDLFLRVFHGRKIG